MREGTRRDRFRVAERLRLAEIIEENVRKGRTTFDRDPSTRYAVEHAVELFSEAAEKVSARFERANPGIPWKGLRPLRRDVAHPVRRRTTSGESRRCVAVRARRCAKDRAQASVGDLSRIGGVSVSPAAMGFCVRGPSVADVSNAF